ncbi:MAG: acyltransferase family protein, partial [Sphingomonadaceae bacterium]
LLMIALNDRRYHWIIAVIILLPLFVSRTGTEVTLSMITYYCGVYTVGMIIGLNVQPRVDFLNRHVRMTACIALVAAVFIAILDWRHIDYMGFTSLRESGFYVLRLALAALMIVWLYRWSPDMRPETARWLKLIAAWSFGIYFLHGPLLRPIARSVGQFVPANPHWWQVTLAIMACFTAGLLLSMAIVAVVKKVTGTRSKYVIGA